MYAGLAGSLAQGGQKQEALRFLNLAHEKFPEKPEDDPSYLHAGCGYFTLLLWTGLTYFDLKQPREALNTFAQVDGLHPKIDVPERVRLEFLNYQATALIELNDLEQSTFYLESAIKGALALGSERRLSEALDVYQQMQQVWPNEPPLKRLQDLLKSFWLNWKR